MASPKVIITGTGRAGTTFLVQLLTELGFDTGFSTAAGPESGYFQHCSAGLEHDALAQASAYIVKNPAFCDTLPALLESGAIALDHVYIPMRELDEAAASRCRVGPGDAPGGLWDATDFDSQRAALAVKFHRLIHALVAHEVAFTLLEFPRIVRDPVYTYAKLAFLTAQVGRPQFEAAFRQVARPEMVHPSSSDHAAPPTPGPGTVLPSGQSYLREQRRKRIRRRLWRAMAGAALVVLGLVSGMVWAGG